VDGKRPWPRLDSIALELEHHFIPGNGSIIGDTHDVRLVGMKVSFWLCGRSDPFDALEQLGVAGRTRPSLADQGVQARHLRDPHRRLDVAQAVVEAEIVERSHVEGARRASRGTRSVIAKRANTGGEAVVLGGEHPTLPGGHDLARMERETRDRTESTHG